MRTGSFRAQRLPLLHTEAVLLVDNDEPEIGERGLPQQRVRPDHDERLPEATRSAALRRSAAGS